MDNNDVKILFTSKMNGDFLILSGESKVNVNDFIIQFANAPSNPTYSELIAINGHIDTDNQGKGYKHFFDQCKTDGILV